MNIQWISLKGEKANIFSIFAVVVAAWSSESAAHTDTHIDTCTHTYAHTHICTQLSQAAGKQWDGWPRLGAGFEDMQEKPSAYKVRNLYSHSLRNQGREVEIIPTFFLPQNIVNFLSNSLGFFYIYIFWR